MERLNRPGRHRDRCRSSPLARAIAPVNCALEALEQRSLLCGLPLEQLAPAPAFDWGIEWRAKAQRDATRGGATAGSGPDAGGAGVFIQWTNRSTSTTGGAADTDNFGATFGTSATAARSVVDAALLHWARIITDWNRSDGSTTLQVTVSMSSSAGFGGSGAPGGTAPSDGKPRTGSVSLGLGTVNADPNDSNGWYLDPNPNDSAEFDGTITNAYAGRYSTSLGADLYSVVAAEMAHVLGLVSDRDNAGGSYDGYLLESSGYVTETTIPDTAEGGGNGVFWLFDGPTIDHLMTSYNSGDPTTASWGNIVHSAGPIDLNIFGSNWQGSQDTGNAIYTTTERTLPSYVMAHVLGDAYGYSIERPDTFGTFYVLLDDATGEVLVRGGEGDSNDTVLVSESGGTITISVDVGEDVPGTGAYSGEHDLPAFVTEFSLADVSSIRIEAGEGDDLVKIQSIDDATPITIDAGDGDDVINVGDTNFDDNILSDVSVNGGAGSDTLYLRDGSDELGSDTYDLRPYSASKPGSATLRWEEEELERFVLVGSPNDDTVTLTGTATGTNTIRMELQGNDGDDAFELNGVDEQLDVTILGGSGNDTVGAGNGDFDGYVQGSVSLNGGTGDDLIEIDDGDDSQNDTYALDAGSFTKSTGTGSLRYSSSEQLELTANDYDNAINIMGAGVGQLTVRGGEGNDSIIVGSGDLDADIGDLGPYFEGGAGSDQLTYRDYSDAAEDAYVFIPSFMAVVGLPYMRKDWAGGATTSHYYHRDFEGITLEANGYANTITVEGTDSLTPLTLIGNGGDDTIVITDGDLDDLRARVSVTGAASDSDRLIVDDRADAVAALPDSYTITATSVANADKVAVPGGGIGISTHTVYYQHVSSVELRANDDGSPIYVHATAPGCAVFVAGNGGSDQFHVAADSEKLGDLDAAVTLDGDTAANGNDSLIVYDRNATTTVDYAYAIDGDTIDRTFAEPIQFTDIEQATLYGSGADDTFGVGDPAGAMIEIPLLIDAGGGNDAVTVGGADVLGAIDAGGLVTVVGGDGTDTVQLDDLSATTAGAYNVTDTTLQRYAGASSVTATYGAFEDIDLITGTMTIGGSYIDVDATAPGATLDIFYKGSGTRITLGSGDLLADLGGDVTISVAGGGLPDLKLDDSSGSILSYVIDAAASPVTIDCNAGALLVTAKFDDLTLDANGGANSIELSDAAWIDRATLNGNGGDDDFYVNTDVGGGSPYIYADGGAGADDLFVTGTSGTYEPHDTTAGAGTVTGTGGLVLEFVNFEPLYASGYDSFTLVTPNADDAITIDSPATGRNRVAGTSGGVPFESLVFWDCAHVTLDTGANGGTDSMTIAAPGLVASGLATFAHRPSGAPTDLSVVGAHTFETDLGAGAAQVNVRVLDGAVATVSASQHWNALSIANGGLLQLASGRKLLALRSLGIAATGKLDLADGAMIIDYTAASPLSAVRTLLARGYNGGAWNGNGIGTSSGNSSTFALGYAEASTILGASGGTFAGEPVDGTAVLVRHTRYGDRNLDGQVNLTDFNALAGNFGAAGRGWSGGDFNYDDVINLADFNKLAANFGTVI